MGHESFSIAFASVAQSAGQLICNQQVNGSSPFGSLSGNAEGLPKTHSLVRLQQRMHILTQTFCGAGVTAT